jgi:hypothetical protein
MAIRTRILTKIEFPEEIEVEIEDTVRGETVVRKVNFRDCLGQLAHLGTIDLETIEPAELLSMACAVAKHRAIDQYLMSIGIDPHEGIQMADES